MVTYTTLVRDRDAERPELTREEAEEMAALGFRFAEFELEEGRFRLSLPYKTAENLDRGTLTFVQQDNA
jgi:hypothetical protein